MSTESTGGLSSDFRHTFVLMTLVAAGLAAWATAPAWGPRLAGGDDVVPHLVRADFAFEHIFSRARTDGWFPRFMVGHQEFLFYGPGFTWLLGGIRLASFGLISTAGALKLAGILTFAALPPTVAFFVRACGFGPATAAVSGTLALAVNNPFGIGLHALYVIGLLPHQLAAVLFFVAAASLVKLLAETRARWVVVTAVAAAALLVTHAITAVVALVFVALVIPAQLLRRRTAPGWFGRVLVASALVFGLTAFWLLPLAAHRDLSGPVTTWATPPIGDRLAEIAGGRILFPRMLSEVVIAATGFGLVWGVVRRRWELVLFAVAPAAYLGLSHAASARWPGHPVTLQLANRGLGYVGVLALVPLAAAVEWAGHRVAAEAGRWASRLALTVTLPLAAAALTAALAISDARRVVKQAPEPSPALRAAATELRQRVPDGMRFATERDFPREIATTGITHPDLWLARASGRDTLNLFNVESSSSRAGFAAEAIGREPPLTTASKLARFGVSHVVTVQEATAAELTASGRFTEEWSEGDLTILRLTKMPSSSTVITAPGSAVQARLRRAAPEAVAVDVTTTSAGRASAAIAWSPKWIVAVDGRPVTTARTDDGLVGFDLRAGRSRVTLGYRRDAWDLVGLAISGVTVLALLGTLARAVSQRLSSVSSLMSRRRSRTA